jgi:hypothetical protein
MAFSCTPRGSTLLSMTKFIGAPVPDVVETASAAISIPIGLKELYNERHGKKAKNSHEKLVYCLIELNRDKPEDERLELSKEETEMIIKDKRIDIKDDPRRDAIVTCMNDEQKEFEMKSK